MPFVIIAKTTDIPKDAIKAFTVSNKRIAVANVEGKFYAIDDTCTHAQCSLGDEGLLDGTTVICGCHGASFDITTGKVLSLPAPTNVLPYNVQITDGDIMVEL